MLRLCCALARLLRPALAWLACLPARAAVEIGGQVEGMPARPHRLGIVLLGVIPLCMVASWLLPKVTLVMSPSIDAWIVTPAAGPIQKGDLVQFILDHPVAGPKPVSVTKYVMCVAGDRLSLVEPASANPGPRVGLFFCNGIFLGRTLSQSSDGKPLPHSTWRGVIPKGFAYVGSRHPRGFDSRYLGILSLERLHRMTRLL
ncbi:peptidase [Sphingomonas sp. OTU376]|uniref:peptidase n=1 Tax=Sphingomonas sp. OTU376 TaxID=3043863 RepID=UPI00313EC269